MTLSFLFWLLMILSLFFGGWVGFRPNGDRWVAGWTGLGWVLLFILGWKVFGFVITG
jgi:hypothetical protein